MSSDRENTSSDENTPSKHKSTTETAPDDGTTVSRQVDSQKNPSTIKSEARSRKNRARAEMIPCEICDPPRLVARSSMGRHRQSFHTDEYVSISSYHRSIILPPPPFSGRSSARHATIFSAHKTVLELTFDVNTAMQRSHVLTAAQEYSSLSIISISTSATDILRQRNCTAAISALVTSTIPAIATDTRDAANYAHRRLRPSLCCVTSRLQLIMTWVS